MTGSGVYQPTHVDWKYAAKAQLALVHASATAPRSPARCRLSNMENMDQCGQLGIV